MVSRGVGRAAVQLNPAELGAMHINIDLKSDQINVQISVAQSATREVMEAALPRLREQLQAEGYTNITIDLDNDGPGEQLDRNASQGLAFENGSTVGHDSSVGEETQQSSVSSIRRSVIDLFA